MIGSSGRPRCSGHGEVDIVNAADAHFLDQGVHHGPGSGRDPAGRHADDDFPSAALARGKVLAGFVTNGFQFC
jgi:hypothetical protein